LVASKTFTAGRPTFARQGRRRCGAFKVYRAYRDKASVRD
jgi:hypothetical protein